MNRRTVLASTIGIMGGIAGCLTSPENNQDGQGGSQNSVTDESHDCPEIAYFQAYLHPEHPHEREVYDAEDDDFMSYDNISELLSKAGEEYSEEPQDEIDENSPTLLAQVSDNSISRGDELNEELNQKIGDGVYVEHEDVVYFIEYRLEVC
ncbi:hypothetical protein AB7C87_22845 [Natrarchaeobius sp. A-rgal3]|uniref:hypothetical protein n=1 Tax=Natrarchaeobius versutus TaxID=1679078 RepID=UPI00350F26E9